MRQLLAGAVELAVFLFLFISMVATVYVADGMFR